MAEIHKTRSGLSPPFMKDIFAERNTGYNLRHCNDTQLQKFIQEHTELRLYHSLEIDFGRLYEI